jgi:hypothetical protein
MAATARITKGVDLDYMWKATGAQKDPAAYYREEAEGGKEPPGRWWGPAAEALGFTAGQVVEREPYDLLFGKHLDPRDKATPLGRPPGKAAAQAASLYESMLANEPEATAERKHELRNLAGQQARQGPLYFDLTLSFSKSISVFHASLGELARQAREAGDTEADARWSGLLGELDEMLHDAAGAGFGYFQREAGYTRTGHHGAEGGGQWHEADLAAVHWLQHTSRDDDMQLHIHGQVAHVARTRADEKWRAPDSRGYGEHVGAVGAIVSAHLESAMTRRFGVQWEMREDGLGREIAGIDAGVRALFSARRETITREVSDWARNYEAERGRKPTQRVLAQMRQQAALATRKSKAKDAPTADELHERWADTARAAGVDLAGIAPSVVGRAAEARALPTGAELDRSAQRAVALAQKEHSTWTRGDLIRHLSRTLPESAANVPQGEIPALIDALADRALADDAVRCLEAPALLRVPEARLRADGRSVYQRHGGIRYSTRAQMAMEEKILAMAQREGAPSLARETAARELGADARDLDAQLHERAARAAQAVTGSGLRADQAAALMEVLTSKQTASVLVGPAGSGKTRTLAEAARIWEETGAGQVLGITPSQGSANVLRAAGVSDTMNFAEFLGHTKEGRGLRGIQADLPAGSLLLLDEASMWSQQDVRDVLAYAAANGHKVIVCGDAEQLSAVEGGGAMVLLARQLGFVQLAVPVRFRAEWERDASLRLRAGDAAVLSEYDQHGRIRGNAPELLLDDAARSYVARYLEGSDVLLMAADHADCRELSRRIRDDLIHLRLVDDGPAVTLAEGAQASAGDLIIARENDRRLQAGEFGRTLANGDVLRVEAVNDDGTLTVRRALDADPETGARRFTERTFRFGALDKADSAYAVTGHSAQGRTVKHGLALIRGTEDRQWTYVAMSRATESNTALVMTSPASPADTTPGSRPAPELARFDRTERERQALAPEPQRRQKERGGEREAAGILADNLQRDGTEDAALEVQRRELADVDRLDILRNVLETETAAPRAARYKAMLAEELPATWKGTEDSPRAQWLWQALDTAALAGLDARQVLREAIAESSLAGSRDVPGVIYSRVRKTTAGLVPVSAGSWSDRVPEIADPEISEWVRGIAGSMDDRTARLGEFTAEYAPSWALRALGPVPDEPVDRAGWEQAASTIAGYREAYRWDDPSEPLGPEPPASSAYQRADWHAAMAAVAPGDGPDVRELPDQALMRLAATYEAETAWAPRYVADELRQVRLGADTAAMQVTRAEAEAAATDDAEVAARHAALAESARALEAYHRTHEAELAEQMDVRRQWEEATEHQRRMALAADTELRRRRPEVRRDPLRSAEPEPVTDAERAQLDDPSGGMPGWLADLARDRDAAAERLADMRSVRVPSEDPDGEYDGHAWPTPVQQRDAVIQPPRPEIRPSAAVLERVAEREAGS